MKNLITLSVATALLSLTAFANADVKSLKSLDNQQCVDVKGESKGEGASLGLWPCSNAANQRFKIVEKGDGHVNLVASHSNHCVDVKGGSSDDGAEVIQWPCSGAHNQQIMVKPVPEKGDGVFALVVKHSGKCLDFSKTSGSLVQWTCHFKSNQLFKKE